MVSDNGGTAGGTGRRKTKSRSTTIDLTATEVRSGNRPAPATADDPAGAEEPLFTDEAPVPAAAEASDAPPADPQAASGAAHRHDPPENGAVAAEADPAERPAPAEDRRAGGPDPAEAAAPSSAETPPETPSADTHPRSSGPAPAEAASPARRDVIDVAGPPAEEGVRPAVAMAEDRGAAPSRGSTLSALAAAAVGGLVVLVAGAGLLASGVIGRQDGDPEALAAVERRIEALDARIADLPPPPSGVEERIAALEAAAGTEATPSDLVETVARLEARVGELAAAAPQGAEGSGVDGFAARLDAAERALADVAGQIGALSQDPALDARVSDLAGRFDQLAGEVAEIDAGISALREEATSAVGLVRDEIVAVAEAGDARDAAVDSLVTRLDEIVARLDAGPTGGEIAALSLAVTGLASRIAAGDPFSADIAVVRGAAPDLEGLDALEAHAATGVATADELAAAFPADAILATRLPRDGAGVVDRLFSGAKSLVNYRETGVDAGDPVAASVASVEAALASGDLVGAGEAFAALPEEARAAAPDWSGDLAARLEADAAVAALTERVLTRLRAPAEGQ